MAIDRGGSTSKKPKNTNHKRNTREYVPPKKQTKSKKKKPQKKQEPKKDYMPKTKSGAISSHYGQVASKTLNTRQNIKDANIKNAVGSVKKSLTESKATAKKAGSSWGTVSDTSQDRTFTDKKWTPKDVKEKINPHVAKDEGVKYVKEQEGTAKGTAAAKAYNKSKNIQAALEKEGEVTVKVDSKEETKKKAVDIRKANWKSEKSFIKQEYRWLVKNGYDVGGLTEEEYIEKYRKETKAKRTKAAEQQAKEQGQYTYSKSPVSIDEAEKRRVASLFNNNKATIKTDKDKYVTDKSGNIKYKFEVKDGKLIVKPLKKKGKETVETTSAALIMDNYAGGINKKGQLVSNAGAEKVNAQTAGFIRDSKFMAGAMQGSGYGDIKRGFGDYTEAQKKDIEKSTSSGAFMGGYMAGFMGQFAMLQAGKIPDTLIRGVGKKGVERGALNIGVRKGLVSTGAEVPINAVDALKMATDANGNVDKKELAKWFGINTLLSGGFTGIVGGAGTKMTKATAKEYFDLTAKQNISGLTEQEAKRLSELQGKVDRVRNGYNISNTDVINKAQYDGEVKKLLFENNGTEKDVADFLTGKDSSVDKLNYAYSVKGEADMQSELLRAERNAVLDNIETLTGKEKEAMTIYANQLKHEIDRLNGISNMADTQRVLASNANRKGLQDLSKSLDGMSQKTGVQYRIVNDDDMRKIIAEQGGEVSDEYFYKGFYYKDADGKTKILINSESPQAHQTIIGHETGHLIKSSNEEEFFKLGKDLEEYAKKMGDWDAVYDQLKRSYPEATRKELREEVTCELLGRYVYGKDDKFIKQLAGENPNLVRRIIDYIKELFEKTTDKEMRAELESIIEKTKGLVDEIDAKDFKEEIKNLDPEYAKNIGTEAKLSKVENPETLKFLDDQEKAGKTVEVYRAMAEIDGELYPPMATKIKSNSRKAELQDANKLGEWVQADEHPELIDKDGKFKLIKDKGTPIPAAYNPYIHTSFSPLNDQFTSAYKRPNLVVVKGIVPESELTSGYKATGAKDAVGKTQWHAGVVAGQLPKAREVMLSRWFKPQEVVSDAEVAKIIKGILGDTGIEIPYNVVTPSLRRELEKIGVPIGKGRGSAPKEIPPLEDTKFSKEKKPSSYNAFDEKVPSTDEIKAGRAKYMGFDIKHNPNMHAEARNQKDYIEVSDKFLALDEAGRKEILAHEVAHNTAENIEKQYGFGELLDMEIFGKKKVAPEGSPRAGEPYYDGLFGSVGANSLDESITDAVKYYITHPEFLRKRSPEAFDFIDNYYKEYGFSAEVKFSKEKKPVLDENGNVTKETDDAYMKSVESGDTAKQEELVDAVANEKLKNSKLRDEDGELIPMYHSTITGEFTVFDKSRANPEANSGAGLYFSSSKADSVDNYSRLEGADVEAKVEHRANEILDAADQEDGFYNGVEVAGDFDKAKELAEDEMYVESAEYKTYLDTKNPLYVGKGNGKNETNMLDDLEDGLESDWKREDFDTDEDFEEALWQERDEQLYDRIDDISRNVADIADATDYFDAVQSIREAMFSCVEDGRMTFDDLKKALGNSNMHFWNEESKDVVNELARAIAEELGYDSILDFKVSQKFRGMGLHDGDFHAIVFNPEQIKTTEAVTRDNSGNVIPLSKRFDTSNEDIRFSKERIDKTSRLAPVGKDGLKSKAWEVARDLKGEKFGTKDLPKMLEGKGVKPEEMKWTGFYTYLDEELSKGKKSLTKQEIMDFFEANTGELKTVTRNNNQMTFEEVKDALSNVLSSDTKLYKNVADKVAELKKKDYESIAKSYGEDSDLYKNLIAKDGTPEEYAKELIEYDPEIAMLNAGYDPKEYIGEYRAKSPRYNGYMLNGAENYREYEYIMEGNTYKSPHWDESGVVLHSRIGDFSLAIGGQSLNEKALADIVPKILELKKSDKPVDLPLYGDLKVRVLNSSIDPQNRVGVGLIRGDDDLLDFRVVQQDKDEIVKELPNILRGHDTTAYEKGGRVLYVDEIQSDLHNKGHKNGYRSEYDDAQKKYEDLQKNRDSLISSFKTTDEEFQRVEKNINSLKGEEGFRLTFDTQKNEKAIADFESKHQDLVQKSKALEKKKAEIVEELSNVLTEINKLDDYFNEAYHGNIPPDAPYKKNYTDYAMKRALREAVENDYEYLAWSTGEIHDVRWNGTLDYSVEYDTIIPKFMKKYVKQWNGQVEKIRLAENGVEVWGVKITPEMRESVKNEGAGYRYSKQKKSLYNFSGEKPKSKIVEKTKKLQAENDAEIKKMVSSNNADEVVKAVHKSDEIENKIEKLGSKPRRSVDEPAKQEAKTEAGKIEQSKYTSDNLKTSLDEIKKAGVYTKDAEKASKRFNALDKKIRGVQARIKNAEKKQYSSAAEKAEHIAELKDELRSLQNQQRRIAGKIEQMGKMKAYDPNVDPQKQFHDVRNSRVNREVKEATPLKKEDSFIKDKIKSIRRLWEDSLIEVESAAKSKGVSKELREDLLTSANRTRNTQGTTNFWVTQGRKSFDNKVEGKSLDEIFPKSLIQNTEKYNDFQEYLIMKHVPARHAKGTDIYPEVSPDLADAIVKKLEKKYNNTVTVNGKKMTEIEAWANDVYDYLKDLQQYRVDSGILTKEAADQFAKDYPYYVPTNRVREDEGVDFFTGGLSNQIRTAKGGEDDVLDMYSQLYTATNKTIHAAEENQMLNLYFRAKGMTKEQLKGYANEDLEHALIEAKVNKKTGKASVSFFVDGTPVDLPCSHQLALGLREMDGLEFERLMKAAKVSTLYGKPFKALVTDWNLVFGVRNGMRDLQQAVVNSKDTRYFGSSFGAAAHAIANDDSPYRKLYASMGGERAQLVSYDAVTKHMGIEKQGRVDAIHEKGQEWIDATREIGGKEWHTNPIHYIEGINGAIEMMPRMCEFIGTLRKEADTILKRKGSSLKSLRKEIKKEVDALEKAGKIGQSEIPAEVETRLANRIIEMCDKSTIDSAMRNANDITLNFGRSGVLGKALNMGFVPYLNPSIQGLSKLIRLFTEAGGEGGWKAVASIVMKLSTFTIAPAVFNEVALRNNEDYQNLNTRDKDNNFFIALGGDLDGKFLKIPKPRENAVLAEPVEYALRYFIDNTEYAYFDFDRVKSEGTLFDKIPLTDEGRQSFRTALDNIGVINPATSNMISPLWQTFHNKTWYGGTIESNYETAINEETGKPNVPVEKRADTGTSQVAIELAKTKSAKLLNLSPKKIDNILDSYSGMIYDLFISQTTEEARTRGNYLVRTLAAQFLKDSVFSNKLSTNAWAKTDKMTPKEAQEYKQKYMYDTFKYDDAKDVITRDKNMTDKEKMVAKRALQIKKNTLCREALDGKANTSTPLKDIAEYLGANKTLNHFLPNSGDPTRETWEDYYKNYKDGKKWKSLTAKQKDKEASKFLDVYTLGVKGESKVKGEYHDSPSWAMTGVAAAQLQKQGKLSKKDATSIMKSCGVYDSQLDTYYKYAKHGGNVSRYAITCKNNENAKEITEKFGVATKGDGTLWKNKFDASKGIRGGVLSLNLANGKAEYKDRAYFISASNDTNILEKMNAARGYAGKYGHKTKGLVKLAIKCDTDNNTFLKNEEIVNGINNNMKKATSEEKAMAYVLLGGNPSKNPFGAIGDYSLKNDTGISANADGGSGGGHGGGGGGGGGGSSSGGTMPKTKSGAIKGKITDPFSSSNGTKKSNLNDAYRKKVRQLRKRH